VQGADRVGTLEGIAWYESCLGVRPNLEGWIGADGDGRERRSR